MPVHEIDLAILIQNLDDDAFLAEALLFPEVSRFGDEPRRLQRAIVRNAMRICETEALPRVWSRLKPTNLEVSEFSLTLEPPTRSRVWRQPIDLKLDVVRWSQGDTAHIARIPALGIEVISTKFADLQENPDQTSMLQRHARAELRRRGAFENIHSLIMLNRTRGLIVVPASFEVEIRSPKQLIVSAGQREPKKSALEEVADNLVTQRLNAAFEIDQALERLAEALTGKGASSVLLVGKAGVGKTALVHELVRRRVHFGLAGRPFWSTSGARLVAGMSGYGMWQERCDSLWQEAEQSNAIVHFGNLVELVHTGKSEYDAQGLASFFRQRFARRRALAILECTPEQLSVVEREDPGTLKVFRQLVVEEPSPEASRRILKRVAGQIREARETASKNRRLLQARSRPSSLTITDEALDSLDRLHRRFAGYSAYPSRPLRFLRGLLQSHGTTPAELTEIGEKQVINAFAAETGLPLFLLDDEVAFDTVATTKWFEERVIGQPVAVRLMVELLATVKAGLTRPRRPIASLLFAGPTGVGKTEMAKSLARFFFGDEGRMARFDMSEYADALAVTRLLGGFAGNEGILTARIREQPFSVVLFDEFEKAHHSFFDLLLQTLGDGRLTDGRGQVADFTNSIVVMTSNLGSAKFRRPRAGFEIVGADPDRRLGDSDRVAQKHFTRAVQDFLRPEIFNRIDHIVPFLPLDRSVVQRIAERELKLVEQRDGLLRRGVTLDVTAPAVETLARRGYDAHYGARPLKRLIERELLLPLAVELNNRPAVGEGNRTTIIAAVDVKAGRLAVHIGGQGSAALRDSSLAATVDRLSELRRRIVALKLSPAVIELQNKIWRLSEIERRMVKAARRARSKSKSTRGQAVRLDARANTALLLLPNYQEKMVSLTELESRSERAEDEALLLFYRGDTARFPAEQKDVVNEIEAGLQNLLRQLLDLQYTHPDRVTLAIYSENREALFELAHGYFNSAVAAGMQVKTSCFTTELRRESEPVEMFGRQVLRREINKPSEFLVQKSEPATAIVFSLEGESSYATFLAELGLHTFAAAKTSDHVFVHASDASLKDYRAPAFLTPRGAVQPINVGASRRTYNRKENFVEDHLLNMRLAWNNNLPAVLDFFLKKQLQEAAEKLIRE